MHSKELMTTLGDRSWAPLAVLVEPDSVARAELSTELSSLGAEVYDFGGMEALLRFLPLLSGGRTPDFMVVSVDGTNRANSLWQQLRGLSGVGEIPSMSYVPRDLEARERLGERLRAMVRLAISRRRLLEATRSLSAPPVRAAGRGSS